mmetsp:Transcript_11609/g.20630  ORF Transcript_11609/g.20630 Transcript_11609/m.20630 type:complete len:599 (+) Transcript_11609:313-2109(+)
MGTEREVLYEKLYRFYETHDPSRLNHGIDAVVDYGLAEGLQLLNQGLIDRYGVGLESPGGEQAFTQGERQIIRSRIEMFYLKHDPTKLDSQSDIDAVIEWAMFHGVDALSEKLGRKYQEGIEEVQESDVLVQLESFYNKHDKDKSQEDIRTVLTWGIVNGFTTLSQKMIEKYGEGLGSTDRTKLKKEIEMKLVKFYQQHDQSKLEDKENIEFIVNLALKYGFHNLNTRLQAKYGSNLNTIVRSNTIRVGGGNSSSSSGKGGKRSSRVMSMRKSISNFTSGKSRLSPNEAAEAAVQSDLEYQDYLRKLVEVFYARHDPNRLLEEGVSPIIDFAINSGEEALNAKLRKKYREDLLTIDSQFQDVRDKLMTFYAKYDPSKLSPERERDLDTIIGWALVHGVEKLNSTLMKKYDEDLEGHGLRTRLKLFYEANDKVKKSSKDLDDIIAWVFENSIESLNRKLKRKYGRSLEDTTFSDIPPPLPPLDDEDATQRPTKGGKGRKKGSPSGTSGSLPDEHQRHSTQVGLEDRLRRFYAKKDPTRNTKTNIERDVRTILNNGVDSFNHRLMQKYGESLNSLRTKSPSGRSGSTTKRGGRHNVVDRV